MKKLKTHRYLLVTVMGLLVACTSYTSTDEWPNPRPNSNPDPEPVIGEITSIQSLNKSENVAVNSHADEWGNSSLELDYRRLLTLESPALSAVNALYPRIKKLGDGTYLLLYQQGPQAWNVCAARKSFSKSARLAMLGKLIANTFQEALILLRLFLDRGLCRSKTLLIFSKFKLIGKLKRNPLNFLVKKTYLQAFLQQLRQQSYYDYQ